MNVKELLIQKRLCFFFSFFFFYHFILNFFFFEMLRQCFDHVILCNYICCFLQLYSCFQKADYCKSVTRFIFFYYLFLFIICSNQLSEVCMFDATAFNNELLLNVGFDETHVMSVEQVINNLIKYFYTLNTKRFTYSR